MAWFTPAQSFAEGWQPGPQLSAPPIHGLVGEILQQRRYEQALMQKNIADTIKNVRGEMQANKYLDAAKEAGLVPQDYEAGGVGGATYGTGLAKLIQDKKEADALEAYRTGMLGVSQGHLKVAQDFAGQGRGPRGGARGGRGGNTVDIYDDNGEYITSAPAGSVLARQYLTKKYASLAQDLTPAQAAAFAKGLGLPIEDIVNTSMHQGFQRVPGGVDQAGNEVPLPLSPDQSPYEATDIKVTPTQVDPKTEQVPPPAMVPRPMLERIRRGLQGPSYAPPQPGPTVPPQTAVPSATPTIAKGYGTPSTDMSAEEIRAKYRSGEMTEQEARARLKAIGFSD